MLLIQRRMWDLLWKYLRQGATDFERKERECPGVVSWESLPLNLELKKRSFTRCNREAATATAKLLQSCPILCDPIDGSPPGPAVPGILQARTLLWVAISSSNAWKGKVKVKSLSRVRLLATPWTAAYHAPPSMGFSRQECWSGVPLPGGVQSGRANLKKDGVSRQPERQAQSVFRKCGPGTDWQKEAAVQCNQLCVGYWWPDQKVGWGQVGKSFESWDMKYEPC